MSTRLNSAGPKGGLLEPYMQMANLINAFRSEYRNTNYAETFEREGDYQFSSGQVRHVKMTFAGDRSMPGMYEETVYVDGKDLGGRDQHYRTWSAKEFWLPGSDAEPF